MLCDDVKRVVYFFLDGSLSDQKRQSIEIHLHDCPDCETRVTIHRRLRGFFRRRLAPLAAPETLRVRVVQSLRTAQ
ncbi:MAG TPA: zf-HC2 domain-containing protein [Thermoanaerobaculia bacterium]|jgi:mycothiol system anti-sigma-R factor|nr:zf-HC2 domain-containing protein [Thermoanaerobaculia bacterium]